jgi:diguanylate cyclase (GGDEF)-like protein/PAS domain S-box-containing protein
MATLFAAGVGSWFTLHGIGPAAAMGFSYPGQPSIVMQSFIAVGMVMVYSVSAVLEKQQATERRLQEIATLHELVTENSRDVIILADLEGNRRYVAAASASMGGWTPQELIKHGSYAFVHPEDRAKAEEAVRRLRDGAETGTIEVRVSNKAGEYLWVEASLRVIRDPRTGKPNGVMNILRDISERKHAEQQLQDAYIALQALSALDSLTGVANRRRFDEYLAREWRRAIRDGKQISMLLVDVDHFKPYNDNYGHVRGDKCLKLVAEAAVDSVARPGDLVARYGGDEFIIVLVDTGKEGAIRVGNEICEGVRSRKLPHEISPIGIVSVSIGCATMVPKAGQDPASLIEVADEALYSAKRAGRDRVQGSNND